MIKTRVIAKYFLMLFLIFYFATISLSENLIVINEVMYNPPGPDNNQEFVEIFHNPRINLSGYLIKDSESNDTLQLLKYVEGNYSLIVEEGFDYSGLNCSIYSAGATIGNDLNNLNDTLSLIDSNLTLLDLMQYDGTIANGNNKTLERLNLSWEQSIALGGTPCFENSILNIVPVIENESSYAGIDLFITQPTIVEDGHVVFYINTTMNNDLEESILFSLSLNFTNDSTSIVNLTDFNIIPEGFPVSISLFIGNISLNSSLCYSIENTSFIDANISDNSGCFFFGENVTIEDSPIENPQIENPSINETQNNNISFSIFIQKEIYNISEQVQFRFNLSTDKDFIIEYRVESQDGQVAKAKRNTTNLLAKTWTISSDKPVEVFFIKANLYVEDDGFSSQFANSSVHFIAVGGEFEENESDPVIDESQIDILAADFNEDRNSVDYEIFIYRGNTNKRTIYYWVEINSTAYSVKEKISLAEKYQEIEKSGRLELKKSCGLINQKAYLVVEGLGISMSKQFYINQERCESAEKQAVLPIKEPITPSLSGFVHSFTKDYSHLNLSFEINNPFDENIQISYYSYIYRSSKCYSCVNNRSENRAISTIASGTHEVFQQISISNISNEEYKLKLVYWFEIINKTGEVTRDIIINKSGYSHIIPQEMKVNFSFEDLPSSNQSIHEDLLSLLNKTPEANNNAVDFKIRQKTSETENQITSDVVYESTSKKAKKLIYYLILFSVSILGLLMVWKGKDEKTRTKGKVGEGLHPISGSHGANWKAKRTYNKYSRTHSKISRRKPGLFSSRKQYRRNKRVRWRLLHNNRSGGLG